MTLNRLRDGTVATVPPDCLVAEAARLMSMFSVGALVIASSRNDKPIGVITDRDVVKMIGDGIDPKVTAVSACACSPVVTAPVSASIEDLLQTMSQAGVRRLPLVDDQGLLAGLVSLDDLLLRLGKDLGRVAETIERELQQEHPVPSAHDRAR